ncbi:hypothetical protein D3C81_2209850 [compost metagenome]
MTLSIAMKDKSAIYGHSFTIYFLITYRFGLALHSLNRMDQKISIGIYGQLFCASIGKADLINVRLRLNNKVIFQRSGIAPKEQIDSWP